jgi:(hydroxyamino)benzene mutase
MLDNNHMAVSAEAGSSTARLVARAAACLLLVSLLTGVLIAAAMTDGISAEADNLLGAHINAFLGALLLLGFGWSLPLLHYGEVGRRRLAWLFIATYFSNWLLTTVKSFLHVKGLDWTGPPADNVIFVLLTLFVVLPSIAATVAWILGLRQKA